MAGPIGPPDDDGISPFDELLARFFGGDAPRHSFQRVDITQLMSEQARELLALAVTQVTERGGADVDAEHLLWATTQVEPTRHLLSRAGADPEVLSHEIDKRAPNGGSTGQPALTPAAKRALLDAHQISRALGSSYIGPEHVLLALAANRESTAGQLLATARITPDSLQRAASPHGHQREPSGTPTVDEFGRDLTSLAREGVLDPVVGRDEEIEQTIEVLSRRTKNNPVLIGEAGVGKTSVVEGIAQRIVDGEVPDTIADRRVVQLDLTGLVAGTRYRGDFEERIKQVIDEIREHRNDLIVFIDELHTVVGAGGAEGAMGAGNILKPSLSRGELHIVGATTLDEYRKNVEKDAALERRFQPVTVSEPNVADTVAILRGLRDRYEAHHQVRFTGQALVSAAELSHQYITDRFLPDKAIDLIDQAGARVRLRSRRPGADVRALEHRLDSMVRNKDQAVADEQYERASVLRDQMADLRTEIEQARGDKRSRVPEVTEQDIAEVVSRTTGIPASRLTEEERERLRHLEEQLHQRVIGQQEPVHAVAEAVRRSRAGLGDPKRPIGSFLFLGPTGVGKTELARALAEALFGDEDRMVRLDMSEFQESHTVSRLVGAPPGYVGHDEAGQLTESVRRRPYSVVLLDEIEKANGDVFNLLLQVLDDGRLTDAQGRVVDFRNTVLIMTSNLGSELITSTGGALGFTAAGPESNAVEGGSGEGPSQTVDDEARRSLRDRIMRRLREGFRPEFLNRVDEVIIFRQLNTSQLHRITELLLEQTRERVGARGITLKITPSAVDWLVEHGYEPEFGARPMRRTIQREVDNRLSALLLDGQVAPGQKVTVDAAHDRIEVAVSD